MTRGSRDLSLPLHTCHSSTRKDTGSPGAAGRSLTLEHTESEIGTFIALPTDKAKVERGSRNKGRRKGFLEEEALVLGLQVGAGVDLEDGARGWYQ